MVIVNFVALQHGAVYALCEPRPNPKSGAAPMRTAAIALAAAGLLAIVPAQSQSIPVWRFAQDQQFQIPTCVAPAKLVETRTANGRIVWKCVAPKQK
jgi:hypothetical protein